MEKENWKEEFDEYYAPLNMGYRFARENHQRIKEFIERQIDIAHALGEKAMLERCMKTIKDSPMYVNDQRGEIIATEERENNIKTLQALTPTT